MRPVFCKYLRVCMKELGIRIVESQRATKKLAHRKQVLVDEKGSLPPAKRHRLDKPTETPQPSTSQDSVDGPHIITTPQSADASADPNPVIPSEDLATDDTREYCCTVCGTKYVEPTRFLWVECSSCSNWSHRKCDKTLKSPKMWAQVQKNVAIYHCPVCQKKVTQPSY